MHFKMWLGEINQIVLFMTTIMVILKKRCIISSGYAYSALISAVQCILCTDKCTAVHTLKSAPTSIPYTDLMCIVYLYTCTDRYALALVSMVWSGPAKPLNLALVSASISSSSGASLRKAASACRNCRLSSLPTVVSVRGNSNPYLLQRDEQKTLRRYENINQFHINHQLSDIEKVFKWINRWKWTLHSLIHSEKYLLISFSQTLFWLSAA